MADAIKKPTELPNNGGRPGFQVGGQITNGAPFITLADPLTAQTITMPMLAALEVASLMTQASIQLITMLQAAAEQQRKPVILRPH